MFTRVHTIEKICNDISECSRICSIINNSPELLLVKNLAKFSKVLLCIKKFCKDVCYIYLIQQPLRNVNKSLLYRELNSNLLLYGQRLTHKVKNYLIELLKEHSKNLIASKYVQIAFKTRSYRYRYTIAYLNDSKTFKVLTYTNLVSELKTLNDVVNIVIEDLTRTTSFNEVSFVSVTIPIDDDKIVLKYLCRFNPANVEITLLNSIFISMLIQ